MSREIHHRILIIDDNESIHRDFKTVLEEKSENSDLSDLEAQVFGDDPVASEEADTEIQSLDYRLLLVEDVRTNQMLISMVLRKAGAIVDVAGDGQEAIDKIHAAGAIDEPYDLILLDMQMPGMDGW
jgi:CheY-like chemotaxis protein